MRRWYTLASRATGWLPKLAASADLLPLLLLAVRVLRLLGNPAARECLARDVAWCRPAPPAAAAGGPKVQKSTGRFSDRLEAAVARDYCLIWRQLALGRDPGAVAESFNCPLSRWAGAGGSVGGRCRAAPLGRSPRRAIS